MLDSKKINLDNVVSLLNLVENNSDTMDSADNNENSELECSQSTPMKLRSAAQKVMGDSVSAFKGLFESEKGDKESVPSVINCLVKVLSGMYRTISEQGQQIKGIFDDIICF